MLNFNTEINNFEISEEKIQKNFELEEFHETQKYLIVSSICTIFANIFDNYQENLPFVFYSLKYINNILCYNTLSTKKYNETFDELIIKGCGHCTESTILTDNLGRLFNYKFEDIKVLDEELNILKLNEKFSINKKVKRKKGRKNKIYALKMLKLNKKLLSKKEKERKKSQENEIHALMSYCLNKIVEQLPRIDIFIKQCKSYGLEIAETEEGQIYLKGTISISPNKEKKFADEKGVIDSIPEEKKIIPDNLPNLADKSNRENLAEKKEVANSSPRKSEKREIGRKRVQEFALSKSQKPKKVRSNSLKSKTGDNRLTLRHKKSKSNELPKIHKKVKKLGNTTGTKRKVGFVAKLQNQRKEQSTKLPKIDQKSRKRNSGFVSRVKHPRIRSI